SKSSIGLLLSSEITDLDHETKSYGLDVHWRGWNPGPGYLLLGGGMARVKLEQTRSQCAFLVFSCNDTKTPVSSKTAPYLQVGFGFEGEWTRSGANGGPFIEARLWRGPYLQPISLASGTLVGSRAKTGNALMVAIGSRFLGAPF